MDQRTLIIIACIIVMIPFALWFIRNWMKIVMKKEYRVFNICVWSSLAIGFIAFIILLSIALTAY